jgi:hypothetical protein
MVEWWNDGIMQDIRALFHVALIPATVRYVRSAAWVHLVTATILKGWKSFSPGLRPPSAVLLTEEGGTPAAPKLRAKAGATLGWRAGNQNYPEKGCITLLTDWSLCQAPCVFLRQTGVSGMTRSLARIEARCGNE